MERFITRKPRANTDGSEGTGSTKRELRGVMQRSCSHARDRARCHAESTHAHLCYAHCHCYVAVLCLWLAEVDAEASASKRAKPCGVHCIATWNCNGLVGRLRNERDRAAIKEFLDTHQPDVVCLQEVKLQAAAVGGLKKADGQPSRRFYAMEESDKRSREEARDVRSALSEWGYTGEH